MMLKKVHNIFTQSMDFSACASFFCLSFFCSSVSIIFISSIGVGLGSLAIRVETSFGVKNSPLCPTTSSSKMSPRSSLRSPPTKPNCAKPLSRSTAMQAKRACRAATSDWKPFLAHILGFDAQLVDLHYEKENELAKKQATAQTIKNELGGSIEDISKIEGILLLKQQEAEKKQKLLDAFDFRAQDKHQTKQLVDNIDERIASLNAERYSLNQNRKKILSSLEEDQILFNPDEAQRLFEEAGVLFKGQIKKDFQQLIAFNKAITDERRVYLQEERSEVEAELKRVNAELNVLGKKRSDTLSFLSGTDVFSKYKQVSDEMVMLRADITSLERQRGFLHRLQELRTDIRALTEARGWPPEELSTMEYYRGSPARYNFMRFDQTIRYLRQAGFDLVATRAGSYELAERCPHVLLKKRQGAAPAAAS